MQRIVLLLCLLLAPVVLWADDGLEYFTKESQYKAVKISPNGDFIAVKMPQDGLDLLAIFSAGSFDLKHVVRFGGSQEVGEFHWANNERLIMQLMDNRGWLAEPQWYGEWFAVNADGRKPRNIFGFRAGRSSVGTKLKVQESIRAWGELIDLMPEDSDHILLSATPMTKTGESHARILRLNIYNGRTKNLGKAPVPNAYFLADHKGEVRFTAGENLNGDWEVFYRNERGDDWKGIRSQADDGGTFKPLAFADENNIYAVSNLGNNINGVYKMDLRDGTTKLLYRDEVVDPSGFHMSPNGRELYALEVEPDFPNYIFIRGKHESAQTLKALMQSFPGKHVSIPSQSLDGNIAVVATHSDQQPPIFYLYEKKLNKLTHIVSSRSWVKEQQSSFVEPISFAARDGQTIYGYVTLPPGVEITDAKSLPLVVNPHGGPHGIRDSWGYNVETQMLASHGYAVLQVNFRGSGGFGREYELAGYRQWGATTQYDIIDGTKHLIETEIVDPKRICIYGASFGGYSALQSSILEPELFQCAVGSMGVYDLELMFDEGDIAERRTGMEYLRGVLGEDKEQLRQFSPVHHVDKLNASLLIMHGEEDKRVPIEHAERLMAALDKRNYPYQYYEMDREGHSLAEESTRREYYGKMLQFLDSHLKQ